MSTLIKQIINFHRGILLGEKVAFTRIVSVTIFYRIRFLTFQYHETNRRKEYYNTTSLMINMSKLDSIKHLYYFLYEGQLDVDMDYDTDFGYLLEFEYFIQWFLKIINSVMREFFDLNLST